jgi:hypothetical protein
VENHQGGNKKGADPASDSMPSSESMSSMSSAEGE